MAGSGLQEVFEKYASKTVLTGKAISRTVCGHMLVAAALNTILFADAYNVRNIRSQNKQTWQKHDNCMIMQWFIRSEPNFFIRSI